MVCQYHWTCSYWSNQRPCSSLPAHASNNNNYNPQICHQLNCLEKCRNFKLALSLRDPELWLDTGYDEPNDEMVDPSIASWPTMDYFSHALCLASSALNSISLPHHSFLVGPVAFNLTYDPNIHHISVDDTTKQFDLVDLQAALTDFLMHEKSHSIDLVHAISWSCRATENAALPFKYIQVWFKLRLQMKDIHTNAILPAQTLCASPPKGDWQYRQYDSVVVNTDSVRSWPMSGLQGALYTTHVLWSYTAIRTFVCTALPHHVTSGQSPWMMVLGRSLFDLHWTIWHHPASWWLLWSINPDAYSQEGDSLWGSVPGRYHTNFTAQGLCKPCTTVWPLHGLMTDIIE